MNKPIFKPAAGLNEYLNANEINYYTWYSSYAWPDEETASNGITFPDLNANIFLFNKLNNEEAFIGLFDPLRFFNLVYDGLVFILNNLGYSANILFTLEQDMRNFNLGDRQLLFIWYSLSHIIFRLNGSPLSEDNFAEGGKQFRYLAHINIMLYRSYTELGSKYGINTEAPIQRIFLGSDLDKPESPKIEVPKDTKFEPKPKLNTEAVELLFTILKDYFSMKHQEELKRILETGDNASEKLLFNDNGNRLTDAFKKLKDNEIIKGCQKKDLITWITRNFTFVYRNTIREFKPDTVRKEISRNDQPSMWPLLKIENGQILKTDKEKLKKRPDYKQY